MPATTDRPKSPCVPDGLVAGGAVGVRDACRYLGLGRTRVWELMDTGELSYSLIGRRRVIPVNSLRRLLAAGLRVADADRADG